MERIHDHRRAAAVPPPRPVGSDTAVSPPGRTRCTSPRRSRPSSSRGHPPD